MSLIERQAVAAGIPMLINPAVARGAYSVELLEAADYWEWRGRWIDTGQTFELHCGDLKEDLVFHSLAHIAEDLARERLDGMREVGTATIHAVGNLWIWDGLMHWAHGSAALPDIGRCHVIAFNWLSNMMQRELTGVYTVTLPHDRDPKPVMFLKELAVSDMEGRA